MFAVYLDFALQHSYVFKKTKLDMAVWACIPSAGEDGEVCRKAVHRSLLGSHFIFLVRNSVSKNKPEGLER